MSKHNDPTLVDHFVQLSVLLTGFKISAIAPQIDRTQLKEAFFTTAKDNTGDTFHQLLTQYAQLAGGKTVDQMTAKEKQTIGHEILLAHPNSRTALTAQAITKIWYLGSWYQPFDFNGKLQDLTGGIVKSDQAYISGLAWKVMQSHAMGNSTFEYGYWGEDPPPLNDFLDPGGE